MQLTPSISVSSVNSAFSFPLDERVPTLRGIMYRPSSRLNRKISRPVAPTRASQLGAWYARHRPYVGSRNV